MIASVDISQVTVIVVSLIYNCCFYLDHIFDSYDLLRTNIRILSKNRYLLLVGTVMCLAIWLKNNRLEIVSEYVIDHDS